MSTHRNHEVDEKPPKGGVCKTAITEDKASNIPIGDVQHNIDLLKNVAVLSKDRQ